MKKFKAIIIGFGKVANDISHDKKMAKFIKFRSHAQVLTEHSRISWEAVVDPSQYALNSARKDWGIKVAVESIDQLPKNINPEILVIATRPGCRLEILKKFKNLKGLIIEKPLSYNAKERNKIIDYCKKFNLKVNVNLLRRLDDLSIKFAQKTFSSKIGNIQLGSIIYGNGIWNNGIHFIDQIRMLGAQIQSVQAYGKGIKTSLSSVNNDINLNVILFLSNGAKINMQYVNFDFYREQVIDIWGTKGKLLIFQEGLFFKIYSINSHRALAKNKEISLDKSMILSSSIGTALFGIYNDLVNAIEKNLETKSNLENSKKNEEIIDAIFESNKNKNKKVFLV